VTLSGVVAENGHPIENVAVVVQWSCGGGCSTGTEGVTDAAGRYVIARLPDGAPVWVTAHKDGFVQQVRGDRCDAGWRRPRPEGDLDSESLDGAAAIGCWLTYCLRHGVRID
jgi:hypothetical protein